MTDKKEVFFISGKIGVSRKTNKPYTILHVCQPVKNGNGKIVAGEPSMLYKEEQIAAVDGFQFGDIIACEFEQSNNLTAKPFFVGVSGLIKGTAYTV